MTIRFFDDIDGDNNDLLNWMGAGGANFQVNEQILTGNKFIADGDPIIQVLDPNESSRIVVVPTTPATSTYFIIINDSDGLSGSGNTLLLREGLGDPTIVTLDDTTGLTNVRVTYTGTKWVWF